MGWSSWDARDGILSQLFQRCGWLHAWRAVAEAEEELLMKPECIPPWLVASLRNSIVKAWTLRELARV